MPANELAEYCSWNCPIYEQTFKNSEFTSYQDFFRSQTKWFRDKFVDLNNRVIEYEEKKEFSHDLKEFILANYSQAKCHLILNTSTHSSPLGSPKSNSENILLGLQSGSTGDDTASLDASFLIDQSTDLEKKLEETIDIEQSDDIGEIINGQSIYYVNPSPAQCKSSVINNYFSVIYFDYQEDTWPVTPNFILNNTTDEDFDEHFIKAFARFSFQLSKRLFFVFPYEIPRPVAFQVAAKFVAPYKKLDELFQTYKEDHPNSKYKKFIDIIYLMESKIKNQFKHRGRLLKKRSLWPYRAHDRKKRDQDVAQFSKAIIDQGEGSDIDDNEEFEEAQSLVEKSFNYKAMRPIIEKKMDEALEKKESKKKKPEGDSIPKPKTVPKKASVISEAMKRPYKRRKKT